ncbi:hypothetical protein [Cohnella fermenti]|uniref:Lon proteolytic domain-containing protein n=1 Tax=Cohnella fermenti TaxID=2565925 RepID=A0A4S4C377_9BACL|nr:hypothetical protein [Cohnella fermenti]THF81615.1 hypothetical protein E6C55_07740 [Cohnella fermenti]
MMEENTNAPTPASPVPRTAAGAARRGGRKSPWIVAILLLLVLALPAAYFTMPQYYAFTALGDIVPMREIGVNASVHFVYVKEGIASSRYQKYAVQREMPDAVFTRVDPSAVNDYDEMLDIGEELRNETIVHAVESVNELASDAASEEQSDTRLDELIADTSNYYGDSIGLMLGIGLYEETRSTDCSHGGELVIAGTGTLEADHSVGSVGAIRDKLRTAEAQGVDLFFVPKDKLTFFYEGLSNEEEAELVKQELHLRLDVVPVSTLEEAITYLEGLDPAETPLP